MGRINEAAKQRMISEFAAASALGHDCGNLMPVKVSRSQVGYSSVCSCGWTSNPKKRRIISLSLAYTHVKEVLDGQFAPTEMRGEIPAEAERVSLPEMLADAPEDSRVG